GELHIKAAHRRGGLSIWALPQSGDLFIPLQEPPGSCVSTLNSTKRSRPDARRRQRGTVPKGRGNATLCVPGGKRCTPHRSTQGSFGWGTFPTAGETGAITHASRSPFPRVIGSCAASSPAIRSPAGDGREKYRTGLKSSGPVSGSSSEGGGSSAASRTPKGCVTPPPSFGR